MKEVLYRKYRPKKFDDILGQDHIVSVLSSAVESKRISHAYLFSGPRGTGKTSTARILSNGIGCHEYDRMELDAASSRGIDEIRSLRDGVHTMPMKGAYKVYIIDEVHMLTREAFNALLKTLEEPPAHVVFILATTEAHKLPDTIVSRCQHFAFKKISENILSSAILKIARNEKTKIDGETASLIALFADGSFRDAQTMLDQVLALGDANKDRIVTGEEARKILSAPSKDLIQGFVSVVIGGKASDGLEILTKVMEKGIGVQLFIKFVLRDIRGILMLKLDPKSEKQLESVLGADEIKYLNKLSDKTTVKDLGFALTLLLEAYDKVNRAYLPQLPLELVLAKIHLRAQK